MSVCDACKGCGETREVHEFWGDEVVRREACTACYGTGSTHSPEILAALGQLRDKHPQWGWAVNGRSVIVGERRATERSAIYATRGGGWYAAVSLGGDKDGEHVGTDIVQAFEAALRAAEEAT